MTCIIERNSKCWVINDMCQWQKYIEMGTNVPGDLSVYESNGTSSFMNH